jgi:hypothetical protein
VTKLRHLRQEAYTDDYNWFLQLPRAAYVERAAGHAQTVCIGPIRFIASTGDLVELLSIAARAELSLPSLPAESGLSHWLRIRVPAGDCTLRAVSPVDICDNVPAFGSSNLHAQEQTD